MSSGMLRADSEEMNTTLPQSRFAIPGNGPHTIALTMPLPTLTSNVTIDGLSQPGATAANLNTGHGFRPAIVLDGAQIPDTGPVHGLRVVPVRFVGPTIKGLAWVNFRRPAGDGAAIWLDGTALDANEVIVENNFIGLLPAGTAAGNDAGVRVTNAADVSIVSNVISANTVGVLGNGRGHGALIGQAGIAGIENAVAGLSCRQPRDTPKARAARNTFSRLLAAADRSAIRSSIFRMCTDCRSATGSEP